MLDGKNPKLGRGEFANMPQKSVQETYPRKMGKNVGSMDDTLSGVDQAIEQGQNMRKKFLSNQK
jgi:hypothetical protein